MHFDETTWLIIYVIAAAIALIIQYYIIKLAVKDALKESGSLSGNSPNEATSHLINMIEKQNALLSLLVTKGSEDRSFALTDPKTGATKIVKAEELNKFPLQDYDVCLIPVTN